MWKGRARGTGGKARKKCRGKKGEGWGARRDKPGEKKEEGGEEEAERGIVNEESETC